ncbi:MAG: 3-beta hydroxysteroid dehydrogenase [Candidatus Cloacimonadota bacterium]|nr:MAG: 3-beta hydroxysteroid dehydrogenase [Candidatus Cloacimonadota bacterium]PCJ21018.1 MAG: 3-beta hydroxysteroid dehydrogenase [Candidatus Cloacimonadota bacterium]
MKYQRILITGGCGFVGSSIALYIKKSYPNIKIICLDNFIRKGSKLQVQRLKNADIEVIEGDVRFYDHLKKITADLLIDCSAEPSVSAGLDGSSKYLVETNLVGSFNCLEWAKENKAALLFLSTSRVYSIEQLEKIPFTEGETRFEWMNNNLAKDRTQQGITKNFSTQGPISLYGATKLSSEHLVLEYSRMYDIPAIINRFGVIAGPWQMGKVDQGFIALWVARHYFNRSLSYNGYGGLGKQVRDFLHIDDICSLILKQVNQLENYRGETFQVGGGRNNSTSLLELTKLCEEISQNKIEFQKVENTHSNDIRILLLDSEIVKKEFHWKVEKNIYHLVKDVYQWILTNEDMVREIFCG